MITIENALKLVRLIHQGQTDFTGAEYVDHLIAVMNLLPPEASDEDRIIALFHDTFEDRYDELEKLAYPMKVYDFLIYKGLTDYIYNGIQLLTRNPDMIYQDYIRNIKKSKHAGAIMVKIADNTHNSDLDRIALIPDEEKRNQVLNMVEKRYKKAREILVA